jgi:hypothetical protein
LLGFESGDMGEFPNVCEWLSGTAQRWWRWLVTRSWTAPGALFGEDSQGCEALLPHHQI